MSGAPSTSEFRELFQKKYTEFVADLTATFPELTTELEVAAALKPTDRFEAYGSEVLGKHATPTGAAESLACPGPVLPGVLLTPVLWSGLSGPSKKAVYDYLSILDLCALTESKEGPAQEWAEKLMGDLKTRMDGVDFDGMAEKLKSIFGGKDGMPKIPEKFLKGKLAKLAEDMVREFKPEDFGLSEEDVAALEKNPTKSFEILMRASTTNPAKMQAAMARVAKRLQDKVARGELKPQEIVAEAEEMINEFKSHPAFVEIMETFRSAFSFEDPDLAREIGREGEARRAIVRDRLRKKLDAKKKGKK